jgi:hypothetical protein
MTTYRSGDEPESSPASWYDIGGTTRVVVCAHDMRIEVEDIEADRVCRAFHVEALARAYMAADTFDDAAEKRAALFEALR